MLSTCWHILTQMGWEAFSLEEVGKTDAPWSLEQILRRFPSKHHLVLAFSRAIPLPMPVLVRLDNPRERLFEGLMVRLDGLWPHRRILAPSFLDVPPFFIRSMIFHLIPWFYAHWQSHEDPEGRFTSTKVLPGGETEALGWALCSLMLYGAIFPYALTHSYGETLARLDQWMALLWDTLGAEGDGKP